MSDTTYKIGVIFDANSAIPAAAKISRADNALNQFDKSAQTFTSSLSGVSSSYSTVISSFSSGNPVMIAATLAISGVALAANQAHEALQRASSFDSAKRGMVSVSGSAELAANKIKELDKVARDTQGLKFRQAVEAQRNLQAAGIASNVATSSIKSFANALAIVGGTEAEFDGVLRALTQIASKSQVSAEEINQLAERIPQIRTAMQAVYGTSDTESLQKRGIDPKEFIKQISGELGKLPRAAGSAAGAWENLTDVIDKAYIKIGEPALPTATRILDKFTKLVEENSATFDSWGQSLDRTLKVAETLTDTVGYLSNTSFGTLISYLDDAVYWTNAFAYAWEAVKFGTEHFGGSVEYLTKQQQASSTQTQITIADLRKMDDALGGLDSTIKALNKTSKESYDERLAQLDVFYRTEQLKVNAGIRTGKASEVAYQQSLLRVEQTTYNQRLEALQKFYNDKIARAANTQEKERLITEGKTASSALGLDFAEKRQDIANKIAQINADIKQQYRADLSDSLQLELDKASTALQNTLDDLSNKFSTGNITAATYWEIAKKSLNDYNEELYRVRNEQYQLNIKNPALTE